jgi:hypothetical protein
VPVGRDETISDKIYFEPPESRHNARRFTDMGPPKTLISTDLRVDAIATSGSLVAAGASQLTGRLWTGAVLVGTTKSRDRPIFSRLSSPPTPGLTPYLQFPRSEL